MQGQKETMINERRALNYLKYGQNSDGISCGYKSTKHQTFHKWKPVHEEGQTTKVTAPGKSNKRKQLRGEVARGCWKNRIKG